MLKLIHPFKIYTTTCNVPKQLIGDLYAYKETDIGLRKTSIGGWHSKTFNLTKKYDSRSYEWTRSIIESLEAIITKEWPTYRFDRGWFNINGIGAGNRWHSHGDHPVVGVLYIKAPADSGSIEFRKDEEHFVYTPLTGDFVVFPGDLDHQVLASKTTDERISMAINFRSI